MMEKSERDLLVELLTKVRHIESNLEKVSNNIQEEYKVLEKRVALLENQITALQTKIAVYGGIIVLLAPLLSTLLNHFLNNH